VGTSSDDLTNLSEKDPFFPTTFPRPFKDQSSVWRNDTSFGPNDLEPLLFAPH
jgi:hypothetical protein